MREKTYRRDLGPCRRQHMSLQSSLILKQHHCEADSRDCYFSLAIAALAEWSEVYLRSSVEPRAGTASISRSWSNEGILSSVGYILR